MHEQVNEFIQNNSAIKRLSTARFYKRLQEVDLSPAQAEVLFIVADYPDGIQPKAIAADLHLTPGAISQLLDSLAHSDMISRNSSMTDRRAILISLAPRGSKVLKALEQSRRDFAKAIAAQLTAAELDRLIKTQQKILNHLRKEQHGSNQSD